MSTNTVLSDFAAALLSGSIKIVDLTAPLAHVLYKLVDV